MEGIYYYFRHEKAEAQLVLADSFSAHDRTPRGYAEIPFDAPEPQAS